jgi:predicted ATPase
LPGNRLVTVVGAGGIGKTRLGLRLAAEVIEDYRDGVWLVELGSINDPLLVPASVAQVFGVQEKSGTPLTHTLCGHFRGRQLLLVVDNCEHLLDACAKLGDAVLRTAPKVTILATSRLCTSPVNRSIRCNRSRFPKQRRTQRQWHAPRRYSSSSSAPGGRYLISS